MSAKRSSPPKRAYRKRRRAEQEEETRRRITEAAVQLRGSVGPARTTVSAVADAAGVQRATVYRHFPDEDALFLACSSHWLGEHPLPDISRWTAIEEPDGRLRESLSELYAWYERGEDMLERTTRDVALVPALEAPMKGLAAWLDAAADAVAGERGEDDPARDRVRATVGHALAFETWRSLVRRQSLPAPTAIDLMTRLVASAADRET